MNDKEFQEKYPALTKISNLGREWTAVMNFLTHLKESGFSIETPGGERLGRYEGLLHEYFGLDPNEVEKERQDLLKNLVYQDD
jgi:hypothetical protein